MLTAKDSEANLGELSVSVWSDGHRLQVPQTVFEQILVLLPRACGPVLVLVTVFK